MIKGVSQFQLPILQINEALITAVVADNVAPDRYSIQFKTKGGKVVPAGRSLAITGGAAASAPAADAEARVSLAPTDTAAPIATHAATPKPEAQPTLEINEPVGAIDCTGTGSCLFSVKGKSSNVVSNRDLRIYIFVFPLKPVGAGWYQQVSPANVRQDGTWLQTPSWLGNARFPAKSDHTFEIVALVVHKDAEWRGTKLSDWPPGEAIHAFQDVDYVALSDIVSLRVR